MDWAYLEQLVRWGFSIGSHTLTHPELRFLSSDDARHEIAHSRSVLEDRLSVPATTFCYPFGEWDETSYRLVRAAGYRAASNDTWRDEHRPLALARTDPRHRPHPLAQPAETGPGRSPRRSLSAFPIPALRATSALRFPPAPLP